MRDSARVRSGGAGRFSGGHRRRRDRFQARAASGAHHGWSSEQALEAVVLTALISFMNTVQMGLATHPDFTPPRRFPIEPSPTTGDDRAEPVEGVKPQRAEEHPIDATVQPAIGDRQPTGADDDGALVRRAQAGDLGAFEQLVERHTPRVYRAIVSIVGGHGDAEDAVQETFLKVFRHLSGFQGASRFSTWVTRIAINEGLQQL
ncbi:MAG: sigma-70 family RNA polymerase sigma factor, partial [Vicinamibacterales bacterium]